jgi:hypothetical protein
MQIQLRFTNRVNSSLPKLYNIFISEGSVIDSDTRLQFVTQRETRFGRRAGNGIRNAGGTSAWLKRRCPIMRQVSGDKPLHGVLSAPTPEGACGLQHQGVQPKAYMKLRSLPTRLHSSISQKIAVFKVQTAIWWLTVATQTDDMRTRTWIQISEYYYCYTVIQACYFAYYYTIKVHLSVERMVHVKRVLPTAAAENVTK